MSVEERVLGIARYDHGIVYLPPKVVKYPEFPYVDGEVFPIRIDAEKRRIVTRHAKWWEMLDWSKMPEMYQRLLDEVKEKIKQAGLV